MPRKKALAPDKKHVNPVAKMKRAAQVRRPGSPKPKPRVVVGTATARALGIK